MLSSFSHVDSRIKDFFENYAPMRLYLAIASTAFKSGYILLNPSSLLNHSNLLILSQSDS